MRTLILCTIVLYVFANAMIVASALESQELFVLSGLIITAPITLLVIWKGVKDWPRR